jgi:hypothetical protein
MLERSHDNGRDQGQRSDPDPQKSVGVELRETPSGEREQVHFPSRVAGRFRRVQAVAAWNHFLPLQSSA